MSVKSVKGTRDFGPVEYKKRKWVMDTIKSVYDQFGFNPLETPAMESMDVLGGKYGDEGDQLIFRILNSGDFAKDIDSTETKEIRKKISEKGLRYDLTIPFARYLVNNRNSISLPFKRYQMQPVWRADRPQKGRYREFYQCDIDVAGSNSLICEAEILTIITKILDRLSIKDYTIKLNNRKILKGLAEFVGCSDVVMATSLDKLDKIGEERVKEEMISNGVTSPDLVFSTLSDLKDDLNETTSLGFSEISKVIKYVNSMGGNIDRVEFDPTLARGLNYYTGCIFEVKIGGVSIGSVGGGGRYDNLTSLFGWDGVSGVGFSFGLDRLCDCLEELNLFPKIEDERYLVLNFGDEDYCLDVLMSLRDKGLKVEIFPDRDKIQKQMKWANDNNISYVIICGDKEKEKSEYVVKNMATGEQKSIKI